MHNDGSLFCTVQFKVTKQRLGRNVIGAGPASTQGGKARLACCLQILASCLWYVYIYIYICMYMCIYAYTIYIYIYTHTYLHTYTYIYIYICICKNKCVYIYIYTYALLLLFMILILAVIIIVLMVHNRNYTVHSGIVYLPQASPCRGIENRTWYPETPIFLNEGVYLESY